MLIFISFLALVAFVWMTIMATVYVNFTISDHNTYLQRHLMVNTKLNIVENIQDDVEEDESFSDPLIRKLMGEEDKSNGVKYKQVYTRSIIDLEEVVTFEEWTSSSYEDEKIKSDLTLVTFKNGDQMHIVGSFDELNVKLEEYLGARYYGRLPESK